MCPLGRRCITGDNMNRAAMLTFIARRDQNLMRRIHRWPAPRWIRVWMICATRGGDGWLWYGMGLIILLFGGADRFSFPSGHTITAFTVAVSLSMFYPSLTVGLLFCAVSVAASRILLGMHFLSDVLAGALIGTTLAYLSVHLLRLL